LAGHGASRVGNSLQQFIEQQVDQAVRIGLVNNGIGTDAFVGSSCAVVGGCEHRVTPSLVPTRVIGQFGLSLSPYLAG
jgi:hypothetical protein